MLRNREFRNFCAALLIVGAVGSAVAFVLAQAAGFVCLGCFALSSALFIWYTRRRYRKIAELSRYIERMSAGQFGLDIRDNSEGELSILSSGA